MNDSDMQNPGQNPEQGAGDTATPPPPTLILDAVHKSFTQGGTRQLHVLRGANLTLQPGEIVALLGPSGSGKSTLLNLAGLLEPPDSGGVWLGGVATAHLSQKQRARMRRENIGFIFQFHRLLPEFNALENVIIPQMIAGLPRNTAAKRGEQLLGLVGLAERLHHRPGELSGGEQQRVAIARAVANSPALLLGDEPTGNLDPETAGEVFGHLVALIRKLGGAALIVTHNTELARRMDRVLVIRDGVVGAG